MHRSEPASAPATPSGQGSPAWLRTLRKLAIWAGFLLFLYLTRDFFFAGFMTFIFSYLTLACVAWGMNKLSPDRERPWLRRLLTLAVFLLAPLLLLGLGMLVARPLIQQAQHLAGWLSHVSPESEAARLLEKYIGPREFREKYHGPNDPTYRKDLEEFRASQIKHVDAYNQFPHLEAWVQGAFDKRYLDAERGRIRARLAREGASSAAFAHWFTTIKAPQAKATRPAEDLLAEARQDPAQLAALREEWLNASVAAALGAAKASPAYHAAFRAYYDEQARASPQAVPYTFDQFLALQKARRAGPEAFGAALARLRPAADDESPAQLEADFKAAKEHELFQEWWGGSAAAQFIRRQIEGDGTGAGAARMERILTSLLNVPLDLATALLLSFFICIDFPRLKTGVRHIRQTWLRETYDEIVPALANLGHLIGQCMRAQGLIALGNALAIFVGLTLLGVAHTMLLAGAAFVLCLVPTLGMILAWFLVAAVALVQPDGGLSLVLKATGVISLVVLLETLVLSPRLLGKKMELHPVVLIALLPIAQYFFGVWGLILAAPVAVYVIHVLILRKELPGAATPARR
jgi:predicted PurR-regulated permease PerM